MGTSLSALVKDYLQSLGDGSVDAEQSLSVEQVVREMPSPLQSPSPGGSAVPSAGMLAADVAQFSPPQGKARKGAALDKEFWLADDFDETPDWLTDDPRLGMEARERIDTGGSDIVNSVISLMGIAIKHRLGKLNATAVLDAGRLAEAAIDTLPNRLAHLTSYEQLPLLHRDPFERMLVAQSLTGTMQIMSTDAVIAACGIPFVDAAR